MSKKIKILIFSNVPFTGEEFNTTGNWIYTLLDELRKNTEYTFAIAFHDKFVKKIIFENNYGFILIHIPLRNESNIVKKVLVNWLMLDKYKDVTKDYINIINKSGPDLIQIFGLESPFIRIIDKIKRPTIIHIQGLLAPYIYKYYPRYSDFEIMSSNDLISNLAGNIPWNERRKLKKHLIIEEKIYPAIKYCLGRTDWDRRCLKAIAPKAKYYYCQEIMRSSFYKIPWTEPNNKNWIFYTTISDTFYKNVDIIYKTCDLLEKYYQKLNYKWYIAGISEKDLTNKIMKRKNIIPKNLRLLGKVNSEEIVNNLLRANIFVYPSAIENSCNAVEEAMLVGIPIIASYAGGMSTVIENNVTGILVNEGDPYVLTGAIVEMLENYNEVKKMGQKAREVALKRHNPEKVVTTLSDIYSAVIDDN